MSGRKQSNPKPKEASKPSLPLSPPKKGNIAYCSNWVPGANIKKCNWCLELESKLEEAQEVLNNIFTYLYNLSRDKK